MDDYYNEGRLQFKIGNFNQALFNFKKALDDDPDCLTYLYAIGKTYAFRFNSDENYKKSFYYFNRMLELDPNHIKAMIAKSLSLVNLGRSSEALVILDEGIDNGGNGYLWAMKGRILSFMHENEVEIKNCFKKAFELSEDKSYLHYLMAKAYEYDLEYEKASKFYDLCINSVNDSVCDLDEDIYVTRFLVLMEKGWMYLTSGDNELALQCFEEVLEINSKSVAGLYSKSHVLYEEDNWEDALDVLKVSLFLDPEDILSLILKAVIYNRQGSPQAALNIYKRVLEIDGRNGLAWTNLIDLYYAGGEYKKSLDAAKNAIEIDPMSPLALYYGSLVAQKTGDLDLARQWRRKLSDPQIDVVILEKNLQDKLVNEEWRLRKAGYNLKWIGREFRLIDRRGRLDLLYKDKVSGDFVVVELKVVPATKKTYEQIKNYMDSISKTIGLGKNVKGIVISWGANETFKSLIENDPDIDQIDIINLGLG